MLTPYLFDPTSPKTVEEQVEFIDKITSGKLHQPKDLSGYLDDEEMQEFEERYNALPITEQPLALWRTCIELMVRVLVVDEDVTEATAGELIYAGLGGDVEMLPQIRDIAMANRSALPVRLLLNTASNLYFQLSWKIFVRAMELNQLDFRALFPIRVCVHCPDLIIKRLKNKNYKPTDEERKKRFQEQRELAFSIMNSMSIWEISEVIPFESMQMLQNAGRYNLLKSIFAGNADMGAGPVGMKKGLKGEVI